MAAPAVAPTFATDANYPADGDPWASDPTKVDPGSSRRAEGFEPDVLPAEWLNYMLNNHGAWLSYLAGLRGGVTAIDLTAPASVDATWPLTAADWDRVFDTPRFVWQVQLAAPSYAAIYFPIRIPSGARIISVSLRGKQASSSGGFRMSYSIGSLDADGSQTTQIQSTSKEHSTGSTAVLTSTLTLPTPEVTAADGTVYHLRVLGNIVSAVPCEIRSAYVTWDVP